MRTVKQGEIWLADFEAQVDKEGPGKRGRAVLVLQTDLLNGAGHATTIIIPGTSQTYQDAHGDAFPLRVRLGKTRGLTHNTDLLVDQIRAISNQRFLGEKALTTVGANHLRRVLDALKILTGQ